MSEEEKQLTVRVPKELHRQAKAEAAKSGKSITEVIESLVKQWLNGEIVVKGNPPPQQEK